MIRIIGGLLLAGCSVLYGQNTPPVTVPLHVSHDAANHRITITYDLMDVESDTATVVLQQKTGSGNFLTASGVTGEVGSGILPGEAKSIIYSYPSGTDLRNVSLRLLAYDRHTPSIQEMVDKVDISNLQKMLGDIVGVRHYKSNPNHLIYVGNYINQYMIDHGLSIHHQDFTFSGLSFPNLIGRLEGLNNNKLCLINGHFDSAEFAPGADDNGTGVVGVLEAIRVMSDYLFENNVQFTSFNLEELGLIGSINYVSKGIEPDQQIIGLINYEMLGYYSDEPNSQAIPPGFELLFPNQVVEITNDQKRANFIVNTGAETSFGLMAAFTKAARTYVPGLKVIELPLPGNGTIAPILRRSDHAPFWDKGYPALMITDGAETRNPNYHQLSDKIETINFDFMAKVVKTGIATLATIAKPLNGSTSGIDLSSILSTNTIGAREAITIMPNPVKDVLSFNYISGTSNGKFTAEVISDTGHKILKRVMDKDASGRYSLNIGGRTAGQYHLHIIDGHNRTVARFMIIE
ncbi:MAG: M28 family peptidase [Saprospiraceae bacterium]|nr:M28 family peptidase [Saprospiraceae bacterium]